MKGKSNCGRLRFVIIGLANERLVLAASPFHLVGRAVAGRFSKTKEGYIGQLPRAIMAINANTKGDIAVKEKEQYCYELFHLPNDCLPEYSFVRMAIK